MRGILRPHLLPLAVPEVRLQGQLLRGSTTPCANGTADAVSKITELIWLIAGRLEQLAWRLHLRAEQLKQEEAARRTGQLW